MTTNETSTAVVLLPQEINELSKMVSVEKQQQVQAVINKVFAGVAEWREKANSLKVKDINDTITMQMAEVGRKAVKEARTKMFTPIFKAEREKVQHEMRDYTLQDKLWLKAEQIAEIELKDVEKRFEHEATFAARHEAEQKELRRKERTEKLQSYEVDTAFTDLTNMPEETFLTMLENSKMAYYAKLETIRIAEVERLAKIQAEKEENERIRIENEKLKAEREAAEKKAETERKAAALKQKEVEAKAAKEKAESEAKLKAEREAKEKLEKEIADNKKAEIAKAAAEQKKIDDERKAAVKAAKTPKKARLMRWVDEISIVAPQGLESDETTAEIIKKFDLFKNWAKTQIENL